MYYHYYIHNLYLKDRRLNIIIYFTTQIAQEKNLKKYNFTFRTNKSQTKQKLN